MADWPMTEQKPRPTYLPRFMEAPAFQLGETYFYHAGEEYDEDGCGYRLFYYVVGTLLWPELVEEYPGQHCMHEGDCCGRFYQRTPYIQDGLVVFPFYRNV